MKEKAFTKMIELAVENPDIFEQLLKYFKRKEKERPNLLSIHQRVLYPNPLIDDRQLNIIRVTSP